MRMPERKHPDIRYFNLRAENYKEKIEYEKAPLF